MAGWFYMMTNRKNGTLYAGSAVHLARRAWEHREGVIDGFTKTYRLTRLVYFERYDDVREARRGEETIKHWPRAWKVRLIHGVNPDCDDLYDQLL
jgi:putative endonuclease